MTNPYIESIKDMRVGRERDQKILGDLAFSRPLDVLSELHSAFVSLERSQLLGGPQSLTYYCSASVAASVIGDGNLWLTDVRKMNDTSEIRFARDYLLGNGLAAYVNDAGSRALAQLFEESLSFWFREPASYLDTETHNDRLILARCLSTREDDALLWSQYGDSYRGAAVRFNTAGLMGAVRSAANFNPNSHAHEMGLTKVCYPNPNCSCFDRLFNDVVEAYAYAQSPAERDLVRNLLHAEALRFVVSHKDPRWSSEVEYRIYSRATTVKTWSGTDHLHVDGTGRHYATIFLPHWAINVSQDDYWKGLIEQVTLGPHSSEEAFQKVKKSLEIRGIGDRISKSDLPIQVTQRSS